MSAQISSSTTSINGAIDQNKLLEQIQVFQQEGKELNGKPMLKHQCYKQHQSS